MNTGIEILLRQIEMAIDGNLYYIALFTSLSLPDLCSAIDSQNGESTGKKYVQWYDKWVRPQIVEVIKQFIPDVADPPDFFGENCYHFRCSLLHQGTSQHPKLGYDRILFVAPGKMKGFIHHSKSNGAYLIDVNLFCTEIVLGVRHWLNAVGQTQLFKKNYNKFVRLYPQGLSPYIGNIPVVG